MDEGEVIAGEWEAPGEGEGNGEGVLGLSCGVGCPGKRGAEPPIGVPEPEEWGDGRPSRGLAIPPGHVPSFSANLKI